MNGRTQRMQRPRPLTACIFGVVAILPVHEIAAQGWSLTASPMVTPSVLDPNIILTLDDSPKMARAYADWMNGTSYQAGIANGSTVPANTRRFKSSAFNPLYYDPTVTYTVPSNALSTATTFTAALVNGYYKGSGSGWTVNLSSGFQPTLSYDAAATSQTFADHAAADLGTGTCSSGGKLGTSAAQGGACAYYYRFDSTKFNVGSCPAGGDIGNDNCYALVIVGSSQDSFAGTTAQKQQNFANWYSYYRSRHLAMISSVWQVMSNSALSGTRVGWQGLTTCSSFATGSTCSGFDAASNTANGQSNLINEFDSTRRTSLQNWLRALRPAPANTLPATPLRTALARAGEYYRTPGPTASNNPYLKFPQSAWSATLNPEFSCRSNFHLVLAGDAWDDTATSSLCSNGPCRNSGDVDGATITLPQPTVNGTGSYKPAAPYKDGMAANFNSLADVAFHYWVTDLRGELANNMLPFYGNRTGNAAAQDANPANDPAQWQHMVNYVVGVGMKSLLGFGGPSTTPPTNWGDTSVVTGTGRYFDLWHAALDSRGQFFAADTSSQIVDGLTASLSRAAPVAGSTSYFVGASLTTNSTRLTTDSALYQAQFRVDDWTGRLAKIPINADGSVGCVVGGSPACLDASDRVPSPGSRNIYTWSGSAGVAFTQAGLEAAMPSVWNSLGPDDPTGQTSAAVLSFLRGDQSNEGSGPYAFRVRSKVLGDIVDSDIIFAGGENFSYQSLCPENYTDASCSTMTVPSVYLSNTYNDFVTAKQSRNKMLYVGANDGMLHGFDADTMVEQFAYVPSSGLTDTIGPTDSRAALVLLTDPGYNGRHRFYVDGSPWVGDVCFKSPAVNCATSDWRTILIGVAGNVSSSGLGKRSAFALDVTNPSAFTASNVLWEKSSQSDPDLGYIAAQPVVGRLNDGNYYAIFGNGYLSANGCPVLYLVNIATGAIRRLSATADGNLGGNNSSASVAAVCAGLNGLGRPSLFDDPTISASQPRTADAIYVGDMLGQLWKFDVSSSNPANWDVRVVSGGTRKPLFTARNKCGGVQPITGLIEIGVAPSTLSGAMLYFGTGRFLSPDDRSNTDKQSIYGLLDRSSTSPLNSPGGATSGDTTCATAPGTDLSARGNLQEQTLSSFATATDTYGNSVLARNLSSTAINWADKKNSKTGWFIDLPSTGERMVTAPTLLAGRVLFPTLIPNSDVCAGGGVSTIIAADPNSGGKTVKNIFSVSAPVTYDSIQTVVGIVKNLIAVDSGTNVYLFAGGSSGNVQVVKTIAQQKTGGAVRGRTAWREVFQ